MTEWERVPNGWTWDGDYKAGRDPPFPKAPLGGVILVTGSVDMNQGPLEIEAMKQIARAETAHLPDGDGSLEDRYFDVVEDFPMHIIRGARVVATEEAWVIKRKDILLNAHEFQQPPPDLLWKPSKGQDVRTLQGTATTIATEGTITVAPTGDDNLWPAAVMGALALGLLLGAWLL